MRIEQTCLDLDSNKNVRVVARLKKSPIPKTSNVLNDEFTKQVSKNFDYDFEGTSTFYPFELDEDILKLDFNILCIVGASGSGKTTMAKYWGEEKQIKWDNSKSIVSNFKTIDEAVEKLSAVGLNSIPSWVKPRNALSNGEGFRADLARRLEDGCVIDEFTSVVDRNVALSCSSSIGKYIRNKNLKRCVFISCHKDFIDVLCPDYVINLDTQKIYDTRRLPKRRFELSIYQIYNKKDIWELFRNHHYLSQDLNEASNIYVAELEGEIVGMCAVITQPNGYCINGYRVHRLVVLPDFQGLGIGRKLLNWICEHYNSKGKVMYIRTSHVKLINSLLKSNDWKETGRSRGVSPSQKKKMKWKTTNRTPYSFEYIKNNIKKEKPQRSFEQIDFDMLGESNVL